MAASSPAVIYMCLFNKQRWLYYTRLISICNRPLICHLYLSTPLSTNPQMKNPAVGTGPANPLPGEGCSQLPSTRR